jgi:hypothetical protein
VFDLFSVFCVFVLFMFVLCLVPGVAFVTGRSILDFTFGFL